MNLESVALVYFSPTGTTRRVLEAIAEGMAAGRVEQVDLTPPEEKEREFGPSDGEAVVFGVPVYAGRVPLETERRLRRLKGNETPAVIVAVYGNRHYDDALLELRDLVEDLGFVALAGGAFVGEHSYSVEEIPIAAGRPDAQDLETARAFGQQIGDKFVSLSELEDAESLHVPGSFPYRERRSGSSIAPITQEAICIKCGVCAQVCPMAAIEIGETVVTDVSLCIPCCACVKNCPTGARVIDHERMGEIRQWLSANCAERREPEVYL